MLDPLWEETKGDEDLDEEHGVVRQREILIETGPLTRIVSVELGEVCLVQFHVEGLPDPCPGRAIVEKDAVRSVARVASGPKLADVSLLLAGGESEDRDAPRDGVMQTRVEAIALQVELVGASACHIIVLLKDEHTLAKTSKHSSTGEASHASPDDNRVDVLWDLLRRKFLTDAKGR
jgi:hypothetical protein